MVRIAKCKKCGAVMGFLRSQESEEKGICVNCYEKKITRREKKQKEKIKKAWLYRR